MPRTPLSLRSPLGNAWQLVRLPWGPSLTPALWVLIGGRGPYCSTRSQRPTLPGAFFITIFPRARAVPSPASSEGLRRSTLWSCPAHHARPSPLLLHGISPLPPRPLLFHILSYLKTHCYQLHEALLYSLALTHPFHPESQSIYTLHFSS